MKWLLVLGILAALSAQGATNKVDRLVQDYAATKKSLVDDEIKQRKIMSSLFEINRKMKKIVSERSHLVQERMMLEATTKKLAEKILDLDTHLKSQKSRLRTRLNAIYKFGGQGMARLLFSSTSSAQLERNLKILGLVAKQDLDLIKDYAVTAKELDSKRLKFTQRLTHLKGLEEKIQTQEGLLAAENHQKSRILNGIRKSKKYTLSRLSGLRQKTAKIAENDDSGLLDLLLRPAFFEQQGHLPKPVSGQVTRQFGLAKDDESGIVLPHKGLFFQVRPGTPVKSVFSGVVSYVGELPGFGNTVIIDHGDHYYTVYSHNAKAVVAEGDEINQSQVIAHSGNNRMTGAAGLYFEIRHFSEPYDPKSWMRGTKL